MLALCDAMRELHALLDPPLVHRDIKASNCMVVQDCEGDSEHGKQAIPERLAFEKPTNSKNSGQLRNPVSLKLIDFGIARTVKPDAYRDTRCFGTHLYAAPEQFGFGQTTPATDIYAAGIVFAACLLGVEPHPHDVHAHFAKQLKAAQSPTEIRMWKIVRKATALDPAQRYQNATELKAALQEQELQEEVLQKDVLQKDVSQEQVSEELHPQLTSQSEGAPAAPTDKPEPWGIIGRVWNAVLVVLALSAIYEALFPTQSTSLAAAPKPLALVCYDAIVFLGLALPLFLLCADKRRLIARCRERIGLRPRQLIWLILIVLAIDIALVAVPAAVVEILKR